MREKQKINKENIAPKIEKKEERKNKIVKKKEKNNYCKKEKKGKALNRFEGKPKERKYI